MGGNFKVRALKTVDEFFNVGDIIEFKNGVTIWNDDEPSCFYESFERLTALNGFEDALELIEEEGENKMEDLRELIKPCYVVKFGSGVLTMAYDTQEGINFNTEEDGYTNLKSLDEKLIVKYGIDNEFDVVEIYGLYKYAQGVNCSKISTKDRPLIWKREEEPIKSPTQLEIESIELEQRKLADRLAKLKDKGECINDR